MDHRRSPTHALEPAHGVRVWRAVLAVLTAIVSLFGTPSELAGKGGVPRAVHGLIARWIRAAERLARRALVVRAAELPPGNAAPPSAAPRKSMRASPGAPGFWSADSADWSASFRVTPSRPTRAKWRLARRGPPARVKSTLALAVRLEALVRLARAPDGVARRLAARMRAAPSLIARVLDPADRPGDPLSLLQVDALLTAWGLRHALADTS